MYTIFLFFALMAGLMLGTQGVINSKGERLIGLPSMLTYLSIVQSIPPLIYILINKPSLGITDSIVEGWEWFVLTGIMSTLTVIGMTLSISKIGALTTFVLVILGQIVASALTDHFGFWGLEVKPINLVKVFSILIIIFGVCMLIKANSDDIKHVSSGEKGFKLS